MQENVETRKAAHLLGIGIAALGAHINRGNVRRPKRKIGNTYFWTPAEVKAARKALAVPGRRRSRKAVRP